MSVIALFFFLFCTQRINTKSNVDMIFAAATSHVRAAKLAQPLAAEVITASKGQHDEWLYKCVHLLIWRVQHAVQTVLLLS